MVTFPTVQRPTELSYQSAGQGSGRFVWRVRGSKVRVCVRRKRERGGERVEARRRRENFSEYKFLNTARTATGVRGIESGGLPASCVKFPAQTEASSLRNGTAHSTRISTRDRHWLFPIFFTPIRCTYRVGQNPAQRGAARSPW